MRKRTLLAAALAIGAYGALSHWLMLYAATEPWAMAAIMGPLVLGLAAAAWKRRHLPSLLLCASAVVALGAVTALGGVDDVHRLYVLQYIAINLGLCWTFAFTLRRGSTPLITRMAERVHRDFPPPLRAYTVQLTRLWVAYFAAMSLACLALYAWAPWPWWSLFANLLTPVAALGFFVGEHVLRYWMHPEFERVSLAQAVRAYRQVSASGVSR